MNKFQSNIYIYIFREYPNDLIYHILLPKTHPNLLGCYQSNTFNYKFRPSSLPDLTNENYQINFDINFEKQNIKYERILNEMKFHDDDYKSELNDIDDIINKQDPIQVYLHACQQYQIHSFNTVIEGLNTNTLDLSEMSINDLDLKAICLALRVIYTLFFSLKFICTSAFFSSSL